MGGGLDLVGRRQDGSTFPIEVSLNHVPTSDGGRAIAFVTDITERRQAALALQERTVELERRSAQLSRLASELTLAEQHTREQLAKTLHDGLQQLLVSAAMNLDRLMRRGAHAGIETEDPLPEVKGQLAEAIDAARSLSYELFPPVLERSGLPAALAWLADWTRKKYGLEVELHADPLREFRPQGHPHAVARVGSRAPIQCGQARPGRSGHRGSDARTERHAAHYRVGSRCGLRPVAASSRRRPIKSDGGCSASANASRCWAAGSRSTALPAAARDSC